MLLQKEGVKNNAAMHVESNNRSTTLQQTADEILNTVNASLRQIQMLQQTFTEELATKHQSVNITEPVEDVSQSFESQVVGRPPQSSDQPRSMKSSVSVATVYSTESTLEDVGNARIPSDHTLITPCQDPTEMNAFQLQLRRTIQAGMDLTIQLLRLLKMLAVTVNDMLVLSSLLCPDLLRWLRTSTTVILRMPRNVLSDDDIRLQIAAKHELSLPYQHFRHWPVVQALLRCQYSELIGDFSLRQGLFKVFKTGSRTANEVLISEGNWAQEIYPGCRIAARKLFGTSANLPSFCGPCGRIHRGNPQGNFVAW